MQFQVPPKKIAKLKSILNLIIWSCTATFRDLSRVAGFIDSLFLAVGPIPLPGRLIPLSKRGLAGTVRFLLLVLCWRSCVIAFVISRPLTVTGFSRSSPPEQLFSAMPATTLLVVSKLGSTISLSGGMPTPFESQQSSTFRELKAIFYVIQAHVASLRHKKVKVFTDNENASRIVSFGSPKQHLQSLAIDIFRPCLENDIQIDAQWVPCEANLRAHLLSRFVDKDDWSLNSEVFALLDCKWSPYSIDRFASHYNAQVPRFNSKFMSPGCCAVDAFSLDWRGENN